MYALFFSVISNPAVFLCLAMIQSGDDEIWARRFRQAVYKHDNFRRVSEYSRVLATVITIVWLYNKYPKLYEYFNEGFQNFRRSE